MQSRIVEELFRTADIIEMDVNYLLMMDEANAQGYLLL
jgi:hypothetical protein